MVLGFVATVVAWSAAGGRAEDDAQDEVKAQVSGKIVIVGPDGKRQEMDFGDKLPKQMQERIQQHMKHFKLDGKALPKCDGVIRGKVLMIGPDGKRREFNLGETPGIDLDLEGVLPEDLELPEGVEKMLREQLKGIQLPQMRLREMRRADSDVEAEVEQLKQQVEKLQQEVEQLKKQLGKGRKQKTAA
jgi:FtsZ-binding cell division protein ZapB